MSIYNSVILFTLRGNSVNHKPEFVQCVSHFGVWKGTLWTLDYIIACKCKFLKAMNRFALHLMNTTQINVCAPERMAGSLNSNGTNQFELGCIQPKNWWYDNVCNLFVLTVNGILTYLMADNHVRPQYWPIKCQLPSNLYTIEI